MEDRPGKLIDIQHRQFRLRFTSEGSEILKFLLNLVWKTLKSYINLTKLVVLASFLQAESVMTT